MTVTDSTLTVPAQPRPRGAWRRPAQGLPASPELREDLVWQELDTYYDWYAAAAGRARIGYQGFKVLTLIAGASVTLLAALAAPPLATAGVGAVVVVTEGFQQLFKFHTNWLRYRLIAETLREHAFLYGAQLTPYDDAATRQRRLGHALVSILQSERKEWSAQMKPPEART